MKYIKMFDKCAYRESRNVEDYVREDQSFLIAVDNDNYELLKTALLEVVNNFEPDEDGDKTIFDAIDEVMYQYNGYKVYPDFDIEFE